MPNLPFLRSGPYLSHLFKLFVCMFNFLAALLGSTFKSFTSLIASRLNYSVCF